LASPEGRDGPVRLLIVEDHELLAGTLAVVLRQRGLEVHTANGPTVEAVIEAARQLEPALVLLDLDLGAGMGSGLDLVHPLSDLGTRVVMMTGIQDRARLGACVEAGAVGIVSKTAAFDQLVDTVERAAHGETVMGEPERAALLDELAAHRRADAKRLAPFESLSARERDVLRQIVEGKQAAAIAKDSYVSLATVRTQIRSILLKLEVTSQVAAVALARQGGWFDTDAGETTR
jgi:DNA-binding NarL/FixJ family response regulator